MIGTTQNFSWNSIISCIPKKIFSKSCDIGAPEEQRCRPLTHHCYTVTEPGWKSSLCCPKPCREPTPLYINDQCLSVGHRDDPCQIDQQVKTCPADKNNCLFYKAILPMV